jgi:hypothetical protein
VTNCKNCGKEIEIDTKYCPECGVKTDNIKNNSSDPLYDDEKRANRIEKDINLVLGECCGNCEHAHDWSYECSGKCKLHKIYVSLEQKCNDFSFNK